MRGIINDSLRSMISFSIAITGLWLSVVQRLRLYAFSANQRRLRRRYAITADTPMLAYGTDLKQLIDNRASLAGAKARFALTSGSTGQPKRILYTPARIRRLKFVFSETFARACWSFQIKRASLYVFSSFKPDSSLTTMLLEEHKLPSYFTTLQAPYRVQQQTEIQQLVREYGTTAVRLWLVALSNPGVVYSTNPSTISTFLDELVLDWSVSSRLVRDWCQSPKLFSTGIQRIARRINSRGSSSRLLQMANSSEALPMGLIAPALNSYICWTGGYVKPFLDRVATHLLPTRYRLIPMYSMSTETIETITHFQHRRVSFLPLAPGVLYEFVEENRTDNPENLLSAQQLEPGKTYAMVISDEYGLRRYQTGDLFYCAGIVAGVPDLRFMRRRDVEYSFTGEKLTSEQVSLMFATLRRRFTSLTANTFLTCVPSESIDGDLPHYKLLLVGTDLKDINGLTDLLATTSDDLLCGLNGEYESKRASGRLGPVKAMKISTQAFVDRFAPGGSWEGSWETQFKFLPLYQQTWESARLQLTQQ
jgi:hypothetical protein